VVLKIRFEVQNEKNETSSSSKARSDPSNNEIPKPTTSIRTPSTQFPSIIPLNPNQHEKTFQKPN
jgi:hypothetical protein